MRATHLVPVGLLAMLALTVTVTAIAEPAFHAVRPDEIAWQEVRKMPPLFRAMIHGDQDRPGSFTFRVRAAAGHRLLPHTHPDERVITVLEGTYWSAVGDQWDATKLIAFPAGSLYVVPAGLPHYSAVLEGETLFQESGTGPSRNDMVPQPAR
jgi:quercetin dioxygenase-like cupin family protein